MMMSFTTGAVKVFRLIKFNTLKASVIEVDVARLTPWGDIE